MHRRHAAALPPPPYRRRAVAAPSLPPTPATHATPAVRSRAHRRESLIAGAIDACSVGEALERIEEANSQWKRDLEGRVANIELLGGGQAGDLHGSPGVSRRTPPAAPAAEGGKDAVTESRKLKKALESVQATLRGMTHSSSFRSAVTEIVLGLHKAATMAKEGGSSAAQQHQQLDQNE